MENFINLPDQSNVNPMAATSTIILCSGVPWDADYNHVRMFGSKSERDSYIMSKSVKTIHSSTPVMFGSFTYDVNGNQEQVMRCNYMGFQNSPFTNEWKYAFITNITWLSVNSCEISYSLDVWQNNIYDCTINPCFVEREHCYKSEDSVNFSMLPENLETGDIICSGQVDLTIGYDYSPIYILVSSKTDGSVPEVNKYNNIFSGLEIKVCPSLVNAKTILDQYNAAGMGDAVVAIYQAPGTVTTTSPSEEYNFIQEGVISIPLSNSIDGYSPKNQKTLQYPYHYGWAYGYQGSSMLLKFELSSNANHQLDVKYKGTTVPTPAYKVFAQNYNGLTENYTVSFDLTGFVQCAWTNDSYQAYIAQNQPIFDSLIENLTYSQDIALLNQSQSSTSKSIQELSDFFTQGSIPSDAFMPPVAAAATNKLNFEQPINNLINSINAQKISRDMVPPHAKGTISSPVLNTALNLNKISLFRFNVKAEVAKTIDDFFTMFGYPVHRIKKPNLNSRSSWNYVKTVECGITGNCILQDLQTLRKIFDKGVTIWHTNDVGNYNLSNN